AKLTAFGWEALRVEGHDPDMIMAVLGRAMKATRPAALVAITEKGGGVSGLKAKSNHGKPIAKADLPAALESLDATCARLAHGAAALDWRPSPPASTARIAKRENAGGNLRTGKIAIPAFQAGLDAAGVAASQGKIATRRAYGA